MTQFLSVIFQQVFLPLSFALCILCRPTITSTPYLLLFFYAPFASVAEAKSSSCRKNCYFILIFVCTTAIFLFQTVLQVISRIEGSFIKPCEFWDVFLQQIGYVELQKHDVYTTFKWFLVDIVPFTIALTAYTVRNEPKNTSSQSLQETVPIADELNGNAENHHVLQKLATISVMTMLLFAAVLQPSFLSVIYFISFLMMVTAWATCKQVKRSFAIMCRCLCAALMFHISALFAYQMLFHWEYLFNETMIRFAGLKPLLKLHCASDRKKPNYLNDKLGLDAFLNPIALLLCYYTLALCSKSKTTAKETDTEPKGNSVVTDLDENTIPVILGKRKSTFVRPVIDFMCEHSNIVSNTMMMMWSISDQSWLSFVLLLIANLLWIMPKEGKSIGRMYSFSVYYAALLLILQYYCSLNFTGDEFPTFVRDGNLLHVQRFDSFSKQGMNFVQFGLVQLKTFPCAVLFLKTFFTLTFCFTLRQHRLRADQNWEKVRFQVRLSRQESNANANTASITTNVFMKSFKAVVSLVMRLWVWLIVFAVFFYAISGKHMTFFRIVYMAWLLIFLATYQLSLRLWRTLLYTYWIILIIASTFTLTMIYTYQFNRIEEFYTDFLGITTEMQHEIGLSKHNSKNLCIEMFYLTLLVVITAIQMFIFHNKYQKKFKWMEKESFGQGNQNAPKFSTATLVNQDDTEKAEEKSCLESMLQWVFAMIEKNKGYFEVFCLFLELHTIKLVLFTAFLVSINEISGVHFVIVLLALLAATCSTSSQITFSALISYAVSVLFVLNMIYQLELVSTVSFNVDCTNQGMQLDQEQITSTSISNIASWLGFKKLQNHQTFFQSQSYYIGYILLSTAYHILLYRQKKTRFLSGKSMTMPQYMFVGIKRKDADDDLPSMIKYAFNFAFYKFGIEITMIAMVILIGSRVDFVSLVYANIWLGLLFHTSRETKRRIWPIFQWFIVLLIVAQYMIVVDMPPFSCSWFNQKVLAINLDDLILLRKHPQKLIFDFLVLMCASGQQKVFNVERLYEGRDFSGGSNKTVIEDIKKLSTGKIPIETHDFVSYTRNWLDVIKCVVFFGSFWITLGLVLQAGTHHPSVTSCFIVSLLSLGYLVAAFIFSYQGTNYFMRSINKILTWWKYLIAFNIFMISTKACLNLCFFVNSSKSWLDNTFFGEVVRHSCEAASIDNSMAMTYDCLCFAFLILQLRIFQCYDFCHIISEIKAIHLLDSRGAELINERMRERRINHMRQEKEQLARIKEKMKRIKESQQKFEPNLTAAKTHSQAVRYNGKNLYEESPEKIELDLLYHKDVNSEMEEEFTTKKFSHRISFGETFTHGLQNNDKIHSTMITHSTINERHPVESEVTEHKSDYTLVETERKPCFIFTLVSGILVSLTLKLYKLSRNYRHVQQILSKEKKAQKQSACGLLIDEDAEDFFTCRQSILSELLQAMWFAFIANTEAICYLIIFLYTILSRNLLALPIPIMVLLWGSLSIPRPSKRFWFTIIVYAQMLVFVQHFFQIFSVSNTLLTGNSGSVYNLLVLHFALFHRSILKHMGIWSYDKKIHDKTSFIREFFDFGLIKMSSANHQRNLHLQTSVDVYTWMFLCDLINFLILLFGYSAFSRSPGDGGVQTYLEENQIPIRFLASLLIQFVSMIIDRALYLRRSIKWKIIYQFASIVAVHIWLLYFIHVTSSSGKLLNSTPWPPVLFYYVKCIYFLFSAYQIRCGYPSQTEGNFAADDFSILHWRLFELYHVIPFLAEATNLLDWLCVKTSLKLYEYLKVEDIFEKIYCLKCHRQYESHHSRPRGTVRGTLPDYLRAFSSLFCILIMIWGPTALFTIDLGEPNPPYEVQVSLRIGSFEPFYQMSAQIGQIHQFSKYDFATMKRIYADNADARNFFRNFDSKDIAAVSLNVDSTSLWMITPPNLQRLKNSLANNVPLTFRYTYSVSRATHGHHSDTVQYSRVFHLSSQVVRKQMINLLNGENIVSSIQLKSLFPKFLKVMNSDDLKTVSHLVPKHLHDKEHDGFRDLSLELFRENGTVYWKLSEECDDIAYKGILSQLPFAECADNYVMYTFNDKKFSSTLALLIGGGIIGLYSAYILLVSNFFRHLFSGNSEDIIREDLPYVDRVLQLCLDIYLVRQQNDFKLEEDLYAKLAFLYRSPETMIEWTRLPDVEIESADNSDIDETDTEKTVRKNPNRRLI